MKEHTYTLDITSPCEEKWADMKLDGNGRHCMQCVKTVIDFTKMTDAEIIALLQQKNGNICGRLHKHQMNKALIAKTPLKPSNCWGKLLPVMLLIGMSEGLVAKEKTVNKVVSIATITERKADKKGKSKETKSFIRGRVLDDIGEPVYGATLEIADAGIVTKADVDGYYKLYIPDSFKNSKILITVSYPSFKSVNITVKRRKLPVENNFDLESEHTSFTGIIVERRYKHPKRWWQFWK